MSRKFFIRFTFLGTLACAAAVANAQQMAIDRATEVYEKRLVAAEKARADETAKIDKAYEEGARRVDDAFANRIKAAQRATRDEAEAAKLQALLATVTGEESDASAAAAGGGEAGSAEFDALFEKLVGMWHRYSGAISGTSSSKGAYAHSYLFEFKHPKRLIRSSKYVYDDPRYRDEYYKHAEYRARMRDGKIVFENVRARDNDRYEIAVPFDLGNLTTVYRSGQSGRENETIIVLTKAE